jgi:hypothetical protein
MEVNEGFEQSHAIGAANLTIYLCQLYDRPETVKMQETDEEG